jgi:hypothetical protein
MRMIFAAIGGMKIGRGNRSTRRKPTPVPLCPPQNPTWQTRSRTPDRSGGKPATNRLSYGAAFFSTISSPLTICRVTVEVFDPASTRVKTCCKSALSMKCVSCFSRTFVPNIFFLWQILLSYARDANKTSCMSSCNMSVTVILFYQRQESVHKLQ